MPHLDAAYNLARWLVRDAHDAQDVVQEAFLRAYKFFEGFHGEHSRPWLLSIVRNASYTWLQKNRRKELATVFDEELHGELAEGESAEAAVLTQADVQAVREVIEALPVEFREVTILRELEGLSYKEIAEISAIPIGTVMSRLARARKQLLSDLSARFKHQGAL